MPKPYVRTAASERPDISTVPVALTIGEFQDVFPDPGLLWFGIGF